MNEAVFELFKEYHNANYHDGCNHFDYKTYKMSNGEDLDDDFVASCWEHFEFACQHAWSEQQKAIDEQFEMLLNQAKTILEYQKKLKDFKELFEDAIYGHDSDIQSYYRKQLEDIENE